MNYTPNRNQQNIEHIEQELNSGQDMRDLIKRGFFRNTLDFPSILDYPEWKICECCGSQVKDEESIVKRKEKLKEYNQEKGRLHRLFYVTLCKYHNVTPERSVISKAFSMAWDEARSGGLIEVAQKFDELMELISQA